MKKIIVSGVINIETSLAVKHFPVEYCPIDYNFFGIQTGISGVGYNVAVALKTLGAEPHLLSIVGKDMYRTIIENELKEKQISCDLSPLLDTTPQSIVLYDEEGKRRIYSDLKDIQDKKYPYNEVEQSFLDVDLAVICNINFSRELLAVMKEKGICIASDVHVVNDLDDEYNRDFMQAADILFLSNENIKGREREFLNQLINKYNNKIIVIGMGAQGALMYNRESGDISVHEARRTREIINTVGAGDALFSAFIFFYSKSGNPYESIENAIYFASYKIGEDGGANGFLTEQELINLFGNYQ